MHLLRHGEVYNPDRVLYGRLPGFRLSDRGVEQAEAGRRVPRRPRHRLSWSRLRWSARSETAAAAGRPARACAVEIDERLIEAEPTLRGQAGRRRRRACSPIRPTGSTSCNPFRPSWGEPYAADRRAGARAPCGRRARCGRRRTRRSASATSCRSWPRAGSSRASAWPTTRASASARSPRSPRSPSIGDVVVRVEYAEPAGATCRPVAGAGA